MKNSTQIDTLNKKIDHFKVSRKRFGKLKLLTYVALVLIPNTSFAENTKLIAIGELKEKLSKTAKISGGIVAGFYADGETNPKKPSISAKIPKNWLDKDICLSIVSDDGQYEGSQSYRVSNSGLGGWLDVPFSSNHTEYLSDTNHANIGTIFSEKSCSLKTNNFIPAIWNEKPVRNITNYTLLINTFNSDEAYLVVNNTLQIKCSETKNDKKIAFDYECNINSKYLNQTMNEVELVRFKGSNAQPSYVFSIVIPES